MEKSAIPTGDTPIHYRNASYHTCRRRRAWKRVFVLAVTLTAVLLCYENFLSLLGAGGFRYVIQKTMPGLHSSTDGGDQSTSGFKWSDLEPKEELEYHDCFNDFQCARLKLPLDYDDPSRASIALAVIRLPAPVPVDDPRHGGMIFTNPGGPGGSGVEIVRGAGRELQWIVSTAGNSSVPDKYFDIIAFDPRGVANSRPRPTCISGKQTKHSFFLRAEELGAPDSSDAALGEIWAMQQAYAPDCDRGNKDSIKRHMSTAYVSRDIVELLDKDAAWRKAQSSAEKSIATHKSKDELPKLQYWGFSYGTILGATFAAMYPERVGRVILDGVDGLDDYYRMKWSTNLVDTEATLQYLYDSCAAAAPGRCKLATKGDTPADIQMKVQSTLRSLKEQPMGAPNDGKPEIVTYSDLKALIFQGLYTPTFSYPGIATIIAELHDGNPDNFAKMLQPEHVVRCGEDEEQDAFAQFAEASQTIMCTDGDDISNSTIRDFENHWRKMEAISPLAGAIWSTIQAGCMNWPIRPKWRFEAPGGTTKTANPLLLIGNTADPVTPLANARIVSDLFPGSRVLVQNSAGHCSISSLALCTGLKVRKFFYDGTLPAEGTVCQGSAGPFDDPMDYKTMSVGEVEHSRASQQMALAFRNMRVGLGQSLRRRSRL